MIAINTLLEYQAELAAALLDNQGKKYLNYVDMVIDDTELSKVLKERTELDNAFLISVMPSFKMKGVEDNLEWDNVMQFFILEKTDYSEHDRDSFRNIFVRTQNITKLVVEKLLDDKANYRCGFLAFLVEETISVDPVWKKDGCNGWTLQFNLDTPV